jgi:predicted small integral membrane protein
VVAAPDRVTIWASQLAANDFPPVCAMTGRPVEVWRRFKFATSPAWTYSLLILVCLGGIGIFLYAIVTTVVAQRASGFLPLTHKSSRTVTLATWVPIVLIVLCVPVWIAAGVVAANSPNGPSQGNTGFAYATWVPDPSVTGGPEPGFKPAFSGLTGLDITSASAAIDQSGASWVVNVVFTPHGADLFAQLTRVSAAACAGDPNTDANAVCAQRHLAMWIGLTQTDIDAWGDPLYADRISKPFGSGGDLVSDPLVLSEIDGGQMQVATGLDQQGAEHLATVIGPQATTDTAWSAAVVIIIFLGIFSLVAGLIGRLVIAPLVRPRARVMEIQPGQNDRLVELRNVNPAFVAAVHEAHVARMAQSPGSN